MSYEQRQHKNRQNALWTKYYIKLYPITPGAWLDSDIQNNPDIGDGGEGERQSPHKKQ